MEKKRVNWIDDARGLSVFCVLLAHCDIEHHFFQSYHSRFFNYLGKNSLAFFAFNGKSKAIAVFTDSYSFLF